ncbi:hypothetical protein EV182_003285, partial [Spiromyces aspiralis]
MMCLCPKCSASTASESFDISDAELDPALLAATTIQRRQNLKTASGQMGAKRRCSARLRGMEPAGDVQDSDCLATNSLPPGSAGVNDPSVADDGTQPEMQYVFAPEEVIVTKKHRGRPPKIDISFELVLDDTFRQCELGTPAHSQIPYKVLSPELPTISIRMFGTDPFGPALSAGLQQLGFKYDPVYWVLVHNNLRVYPSTTPLSLGLRKSAVIELFPKTVYERRRQAQMQTREATVQQLAEEERAYKDYQRWLEVHRKQAPDSSASAAVVSLESDDGSDGGEGDGERGGGNTNAQADRISASGQGPATAAEQPPPPGSAEPQNVIRIKVRDQTGKDQFLMVSQASKIQAIIDAYKRLSNLDPTTKVVLEFDDERLDPDSTLDETEIEDEDMITAFV